MNSIKMIYFLLRSLIYTIRYHSYSFERNVIKISCSLYYTSSNYMVAIDTNVYQSPLVTKQCAMLNKEYS